MSLPVLPPLPMAGLPGKVPESCQQGLGHPCLNVCWASGAWRPSVICCHKTDNPGSSRFNYDLIISQDSMGWWVLSLLVCPGSFLQPGGMSGSPCGPHAVPLYSWVPRWGEQTVKVQGFFLRSVLIVTVVRVKNHSYVHFKWINSVGCVDYIAINLLEKVKVCCLSGLCPRPLATPWHPPGLLPTSGLCLLESPSLSARAAVSKPCPLPQPLAPTTLLSVSEFYKN